MEKPPPGRSRQWDGQRWLEWDGQQWAATEPTLSPPAPLSPGGVPTETKVDSLAQPRSPGAQADPFVQWDGASWVRWTGTHWVPVNSGFNGLAIASMLLGVATIVTLGLTGLAALPLGIVAVRQITRRGQRGRGMGIAGIVLGLLGCLGVVYLAVLAVFGLHD